MNEITYILGAGASCQSMPLVNNFADRFNIYLNFLRVTSSHRTSFIEDNRDFINNVGAHLSFDTFFKKLFHRNSIKDIVKYKNLLLYFFIFEHLCPVWLYNVRYNSDFSKKLKKFNVDPRYDSLIAGLLKPIQGQCEFYTKINLITWNYDLNILNAARNFLYYPESIDSIMGRFQVEKNVFELDRQLKIIHLNGFIRHPAFNNSNEFNEDDFLKLFEKLIEKYLSGSDLESTVKNLSFAWENMSRDNSEIPSFISTASNAIRNSQSVIVIGYSFPLYNRLFDQMILSNENLHGKKFFLRDPKNLEIQEVLYSDFNLPRNSFEKIDGMPELDSSSSCDSFFVPNQIFK